LLGTVPQALIVEGDPTHSKEEKLYILMQQSKFTVAYMLAFELFADAQRRLLDLPDIKGVITPRPRSDASWRRLLGNAAMAFNKAMDEDRAAGGGST
jgi:hypothetical protein